MVVDEKDKEYLNNIKNNPNIIWELYYEDIQKYIKSIIRKMKYKGDIDILNSQAYIYFRELCNKYKPYYEKNRFMPFNKYLRIMLYTKLINYLNQTYNKNSREITIDKDSYLYQLNFINKKPITINIIEETLSLLSDFPQHYKVIKLMLKGYNQTQIGKVLNVSQPRVSKILKEIRNPKNIKLKNAIQDIKYLLN